MTDNATDGTEQIRDLDDCRKGHCEVCGEPVYYDFPSDSVLCADHTQSTGMERDDTSENEVLEDESAASGGASEQSSHESI